MHKKLPIFVLILFTILFTVHEMSLYAQEPEAGQSTSPPQPQQKNSDISFNFDDEDVFSAIQTIFGDILKVNYIIDPQVKGRVNLRTVTPVAKENVLPLMKTILKLNGIGILEENNLYKIVRISEISKEQIKPHVFVFPVQNSNAKHVASVLQQILLGIKPAAPVKPAAITQETQSSAPQPQVSGEQTGGDALVSGVTKIFHDEITNTIIILSTPED